MNTEAASVEFLDIDLFQGIATLLASEPEIAAMRIFLILLGFLLIYLGVILAVIKYRMVGEDQPEAYRIPGGYLVPVASALAVVWFLSCLPANELFGMSIFLVAMSAIYLSMNLRRRGTA